MAKTDIQIEELDRRISDLGTLASETEVGLVGTGTQTFAGNKTFTGSTTLGNSTADAHTINGKVSLFGSNLDDAAAFLDTASMTSIGIADDGTKGFFTGTNAVMLVVAANATDHTGALYIGVAGTFTKIAGHASWTNADTDTFNCIYQSGSDMILKNRVGSTKSYRLLVMRIDS